VLGEPLTDLRDYLFVHDGDSGASIAGLYSLVATCKARSIKPFEYLADVLARVQDHPTKPSTSCFRAPGRRPATNCKR
jgi:hypothetical protein